MAAAAKLAALVTLLLALLGPVACLDIFRPGCFVGWVPIVSLLCPQGPGPVPLPSPSPAPTGSGLSVGHYNKNNSYCPNAEELVRKAVEEAIYSNRGIGAGLIRLFFHDAFVRGSDASVLLNTTAAGNSDTEREGPPNKNSLRGFEVIDAAKAATEAACPGIVSCADIVAFAARDASKILSNGGIDFGVPAGRYDGKVSRADDTQSLPGPSSNLDTLKKMFAAQGLNPRDMVTLSAAHSIGRARCVFFADRLPPNPSDMDPALANDLNKTCTAGGPDFRVNQDYKTPDALDKQYYQNVLDKKVLFDSDAVLSSSETIDQVTENARDPVKWAKAFAEAMVKMGNIGVKTGPGADAEIRKVCWKVNGY